MNAYYTKSGHYFSLVVWSGYRWADASGHLPFLNNHIHQSSLEKELLLIKTLLCNIYPQEAIISKGIVIKKNKNCWTKTKTLFQLWPELAVSLNNANTCAETSLSPEILFPPSITIMMFSSAASNDFVAASDLKF